MSSCAVSPCPLSCAKQHAGQKQQKRRPATRPRPHILKQYCFKMCGRGRVAGRRFCCFCPACCLAHDSGQGLTAQLDIPDCKRRHLSCFEGSEKQITCTAAAGLANAKARAKVLWGQLKPLLKAGKFAVAQVRVPTPAHHPAHSPHHLH